MKIDDKIYLLYDLVEEVKPGVALACATHGKYLDIDIYSNNEVLHSYTNMSRYKINKEHLIIYSGEQYNVGVHEIINIEELTRLSDRFNENEFRRLGGNYEKMGGVYTCRVYKTTGSRQLIFNRELEVLNSDFKEVYKLNSFGKLCSFVTNISDVSSLFGFKANKVVMCSRTGKVLYTRKTVVGIHDSDEITDGVRIIVIILTLSLIVGIAAIIYMMAKRL